MKRRPAKSYSTGVSPRRWLNFIDDLSPSQIHDLVDFCIHDRVEMSEDIYTKLFIHQINLDKIKRLFKAFPPSSEEFPPQPRLVGIEENPGPLTITNKGKIIKKKSNTKNLKIKVAVQRRPASSRRSRSSISRSPSGFLRSYTDTVLDPWEAGPLKLGYNCMTNTVLGTGYARSSFVVNADGSFALVCTPQTAIGFVFTNNAGAAVATWNSIPAANLTALTAQMLEGRVISGGIRCVCLFPETSASGVLGAGVLSSSSNNNCQAFTPTTLFNSPSSELGLGSRGARACFLPQDNDSYSFYTNSIAGYSAAGPYTSSVPYICGLGFPVGTVVYYEAVINLEGLPPNTTATVGINPENENIASAASDYFATPERLWSAARNIMGNSVIMNAALDFAAPHEDSMGRPHQSLASITRRSIFGSGNNFRKSMVAGANAMSQGKQNRRVMGELEQKDGYIY